MANRYLSDADRTVEGDWQVHYNRDSGLFEVIPEPVTIESLQAFLDPYFHRVTHYVLDPGGWAQYWPSTVRDSLLDDEQWETMSDTEFSQQMGARSRARMERLRDRLERLQEYTDNPVQTVIDLARKRNVSAGVTIRMNDRHWHPGDPHPKNTGFRRSNPEYWFGEHEGINYGKQPVREECIDHLEEVIDVFDLDILELDFQRRVPFFPNDVDRETRFAATNEIIEAVSAETRREDVDLQVRVPPAVALCENIGLDIRTWCSEEWVSRVIPAPAYSMEFDLPTEQFADVVGTDDIDIIPGTEKCIFTHYHPRHYLTPEMYRSATSLYHASESADGIHFFNLFGLPRGTQAHSLMPELEDEFGYGIELSVLTEAIEPERTREKGKRYLLTPTGTREQNAGAILQTELPKPIPAGEREAVTLSVSSAERIGGAESATLTTQVIDFPDAPSASIDVLVNGTEIAEAATIERGRQDWMDEAVKPGETDVEFDGDNAKYLSPRVVFETSPEPWQPGDNTVSIGNNCTREVELFQIELALSYDDTE